MTNPTGSFDGKPVSARADLTTSANQITLVLYNTIVDPEAVIQNLSAFSFTISTGQTVGSLFSSSGKERTVYENKTFSDGGVVSTGWALSSSGGGLLLNGLDGAAEVPAYTIIGNPNGGTNTYLNANKSIAGNKPHNPFLHGPVTFTLNVLGVTEDSQIDSATFSFGTAAGNDVAGLLVGGGPTAVPEPASMAVWGSVLAVGAFARRRRRSIAA
ncbi:MAG: hypothetical protein JNL58_31435 [Planctomyces sp.]|nr:hypothetical protein [Planctomyces sp.]